MFNRLRNNKGMAMIELIIIMIIMFIVSVAMFGFSKTIEMSAKIDKLNNGIISLQDKTDKISKDNLVELNKQLTDLKLAQKNNENTNNLPLVVLGGIGLIIIIGFVVTIFIEKKKAKKEAETEYALLHPIIPEKVLVGIQDPEEEEYVIINGKKFKKDLIRQKIKVQEKEDVEINTMLVTEA